MDSQESGAGPAPPTVPRRMPTQRTWALRVSPPVSPLDLELLSPNGSMAPLEDEPEIHTCTACGECWEDAFSVGIDSCF